MKKVEQLILSLNLEGESISVGELVADGKKIYFKYYPSFATKEIAQSLLVSD